MELILGKAIAVVCLGPLLIETHMNVYRNAEAECDRIEQRDVSLNDRICFHAFDSAAARRRGQTHSFGELDDRHFSLTLQDRQNFRIDSVEHKTPSASGIGVVCTTQIVQQ